MFTSHATGSKAAFRSHLEAYLCTYFKRAVRVLHMEPLGEDEGEKGFGYGAPVKLQLEGAPLKCVVLHTTRTAGFGHDSLTDRAAAALMPYETFNTLPFHVPVLDVGAIEPSGSLRSFREVDDFYWVTAYAEGSPYFLDLERVVETGLCTPRDTRRVDSLADVLAELHAQRHESKEFYRRRIRDLVGHHECIAGLVDSYDGYDITAYAPPGLLRSIEHRALDWRHRFKGHEERLCRVHGDYHPWNILFDEDDHPTLLDRSRGEWGEAADDVSCLAINFLFFGLRAAEGSVRGADANGTIGDAFRTLWHRFFDRYLALTGDTAVLSFLPPFFAWRALVVASPLWYPNLRVETRTALFRFIDRVLDLDVFDPDELDSLLEG